MKRLFLHSYLFLTFLETFFDNKKMCVALCSCMVNGPYEISVEDVFLDQHMSSWGMFMSIVRVDVCNIY